MTCRKQRQALLLIALGLGPVLIEPIVEQSVATFGIDASVDFGATVAAAIPTNTHILAQRTPSGRVDTRFLDGVDGTAGVLELGTIDAISVGNGSSSVINLRSLYHTGSSAASSTLSTTCTPTLAGGFSTTADGLSWSSTTTYSGLCKTTATAGALATISNEYRVESVAPPSADTTAPLIPNAITATSGVASINLSWDRSSDVFEVDGDVGSGVTSYEVRIDATSVATLPETPGISKQLTLSNIGTLSPTPSCTQSGADWTIVAAGTLDGTADAAPFCNTPLAGDAVLSFKVDSITTTSNFSKFGAAVRDSLNANSRIFECYAYKNANGSVSFQARRRQTDGASASSLATISGLTLPLWGRIVETGDLYDCQYSTDGNAYTSAISSHSLPMAATKYWGLVGTATTGSGGATATGVINQVNLNNVGRYSATINTTLSGLATIRAIDDAANASAYSAGVTVAPSAPADSSAPVFTVHPTGASGGQTSINWACGTATDTNGIRGYIPSVCGTTSSCAGSTDQAEQVSNSFPQSGLTANTTYYLRCKAVDPSGNVSAYSSIASVTTDTGAPGAFTSPVISSVTAISQSTLRVTHSVVGGAAQYLVRAADNTGGPWTRLTQFDHTGLTFDRTGLPAGQVGCYQVAAANEDKTVIGPWTETADTLCGQTQTAAGAIKWHPGQYLWITNSTLTAAQLSSILTQIDAVCANSNIKGIQLLSTWASLEGPTLGDYSKGFAAIDQIIAKLISCGNKRLILGMKEATYGKARTGNPSETSEAWLIPQYIMSGSQYGNASPPHGIAYSGPNVAWTGSLLTVGMAWTQPVMDRIIAMSQAYAAHQYQGVALNQHPNVEMVLGSETALGVPEGSFSYTNSALITQTKRRISADATHWPNTMQRIAANYTGGNSLMLDLFNACLTAKNCVIGGPDPELEVPLGSTVITNVGTRVDGRTITANELFRGNAQKTYVDPADGKTKTSWFIGGGTDRRGQLHWVQEVQDFGMNDRILTSPLSLLQTYATDVMRSSHMIWLYGGRKAEVISQINADPTLYTTACPSNFTTGCNTN